MSLVSDIINQFHRHFFNTIVKNRLVYNSCWEDPRIDRQLLQLNTESNVVMLTSAGCNAFDYLLDGPNSIHCVDTNPAQNALFELKKALFINGNHNSLWSMFGNGQYYGAGTLYNHRLRQTLSGEAQDYWDHHLHYFLPSASGSSFYFKGTSGTFASIIYKIIKRKGLYDTIINLLNAKSINEQRYYFEEIEPYIWNSFSQWLLKRNTTMTLLGVPETQRSMIEGDSDGGLLAFVREALTRVFTKRPITDNYFWRVYLTGSYSHDCCPRYLKRSHFNSIQDKINRVGHSTESLTSYLSNNHQYFSHFILLDHQDWLVNHQPKKLTEEWKLILSRAQPGAKILFRSAAADRSFLPPFVNRHIKFCDQKTDLLHATDRVGTYGSTHLAIVNEPL